MSDFDASASILRSFETTSAGVEAVRNALAREPLKQRLEQAFALLNNRKGRVIVTGVGKSGHIGRKLAATMASTGTPAYFVHPTEASHGDLGMITKDDVVMALSWSGETVELNAIIQHVARFDVPMIAITSGEKSLLSKQSRVALVLPMIKEACPNGLAPTTSTLVQLAMGDALAIALLEAKGFSSQDFKIFHPGGKLGAQLKRVSELMHGEQELPLIPFEATMRDAVAMISKRGFGLAGVLDSEGHLAGVITDGDLRRNLADGLLDRPAAQIMSNNPKTVTVDTLAAAALEDMEEYSITALFVINKARPIGLIHLHDLLRAGVA
jgi:arabinose-5-phosphate isomerase